MKIINFLGSSGAGKSTSALGLTYELKKRGVKAELITEFAKDLVFSGCEHLLTQNQLFIFAEQHRRMAILKDSGLQYLITDSPLILSAYYGTKYNSSSKQLDDLILHEFNSYDNINIFLNRTAKFDTFGRVQTEEESNQDVVDLKQFLLNKHIQFTEYESNDSLAGYLAYKILTHK
jgi:hypothetical protein